MAEILAPIVADLGKARRGALKELKRGQGALLEDVKEALEQVQAGLGDEARGKRLLPIVMVYERKRAGKFLKIPLPF